MYLPRRNDDFYWWYNSNIKVSFEIVAFLCRYGVLRVEDDIFGVIFCLEEVDGFLFHMVVVHHEEVLVHAGGEVVVFFNCHWQFLLHYVGFAALLFFWLAAREVMVHLPLFFSSILHNLKVPGEGRGTSGPGSGCETDTLDLGGRYVIELIYLVLKVHRQVVLLFPLAEWIGDQNLRIFWNDWLWDSTWLTDASRLDSFLN